MEDLREILESDDEDLTELAFRHRLNSPAEIAEITAALVDKSHLLVLRLRDSFGDLSELVDFLETVLPHHPNIREIELPDNNLEAMHMPEIARIINISANLKLLDLGDNDILDEGAQHLARGLFGNETLEELNLSYCHIRSEGLAAIAEAALEMPELKSLNLSQENSLGGRGSGHEATDARFVDALANNPRLEHLNLEDVFHYAPDALTDFIRTVLSGHPSLRKVSLSHSKLTAAHISGIASAIQLNHNLTELDISRNDIGNAAAQILARGIHGNQTLQQLNLSETRLSVQGLAVIATALQTTNVKALLLDGNFFGNAGAQVISHNIHGNQILEELHLGCNRISTTGLAAIFAVLHTTGIKSLNLHGMFDPMEGEDFRLIADFIRHNATLTFLDINNHSIPKEGAALMLQCLREFNYTLLDFTLFSDYRCEEIYAEIHDLIAQNLLLKNALERVHQASLKPQMVRPPEPPPMPFAAWQRVAALDENKQPELLFMILRSHPAVMLHDQFKLNTPEPCESVL